MNTVTAEGSCLLGSLSVACDKAGRCSEIRSRACTEYGLLGEAYSVLNIDAFDVSGMANF